MIRLQVIWLHCHLQGESFHLLQVIWSNHRPQEYMIMQLQVIWLHRHPQEEQFIIKLVIWLHPDRQEGMLMSLYVIQLHSLKIWLHVIGLHCPVPKVIYPVSDCSDFSNPAPQTGYSWSHSIILFYRNMIIWQHVIRLHWETRLLNHNLIVTSLAWERNNLIKLFPIKLQSEWQEDIITGTHTHNLTPWSAGRLHDITECHRITDTSTERLVTQVNRQL